MYMSKGMLYYMACYQKKSSNVGIYWMTRHHPFSSTIYGQNDFHTWTLWHFIYRFRDQFSLHWITGLETKMSFFMWTHRYNFYDCRYPVNIIWKLVSTGAHTWHINLIWKTRWIWTTVAQCLSKFAWFWRKSWFIIGITLFIADWTR